MEVKKGTVDTTEHATEKKEVENTFTQADVNNIVARNVKEELGKVLKDLEVEDFDNAKTALKDYKKIQDAQKSELEKALEEKNAIAEEVGKWKGMFQTKEMEMSVIDILGELEVDRSHKDILVKLVDTKAVLTDEGVNKEALKTQLTTIIEEQLPMLRTQPSTKVGVENKDTTPNNSSIKSMYDEKYKNNPYYKG